MTNREWFMEHLAALPNEALARMVVMGNQCTAHFDRTHCPMVGMKYVACASCWEDWLGQVRDQRQETRDRSN